MTLQVIEGFDHMSDVSLLQPKGWTTVQGSGLAIQFTAAIGGRVSGRGVALSSGIGVTGVGNRNFYTRALPSPLTSLVAGFAFQSDHLPAAGGNMQIFTLRAGATLTCQVFLTDLGKIRIQNSSGTTIATGTLNVTLNAWHYVEIKLVIAGAAGSVTTQLDGAADIGTTTGNFGSSGIDQINLVLVPQETSSANNDHELLWDDIYVLDTTASPNNSFLGDVHVETLYPVAVGTYNEWTPSSGGVHYLLVNEHTTPPYPDDDTTYVSSSTLNQRDSYDFNSLSISAGTIFGLQTNLTARKEDAVLREIAALIRIGGSDYIGANEVLAVSYVDGLQIYDTSPATGIAWTISEVDGAEYGVKLTG